MRRSLTYTLTLRGKVLAVVSQLKVSKRICSASLSSFLIRTLTRMWILHYINPCQRCLSLKVFNDRTRYFDHAVWVLQFRTRPNFWAGPLWFSCHVFTTCITTIPLRPIILIAIQVLVLNLVQKARGCVYLCLTLVQIFLTSWARQQLTHALSVTPIF